MSAGAPRSAVVTSSDCATKRRSSGVGLAGGAGGARGRARGGVRACVAVGARGRARGGVLAGGAVSRGLRSCAFVGSVGTDESSAAGGFLTGSRCRDGDGAISSILGRGDDVAGCRLACSLGGRSTGRLVRGDSPDFRLRDELAVTKRERTVDGELDVGLNRVHHSRLTARGDGVPSSKLRQEASASVYALGGDRSSHRSRGVVEVSETLLVVPVVGDDALPVRTNRAVPLGEQGIPLPVSRLEKRLGEGVLEHHDRLRVVRTRSAEFFDSDRFPIAVDLDAHPRTGAVKLGRPRRLEPKLSLEPGSSTDDSVRVHRGAPARVDKMMGGRLRCIRRSSHAESDYGGAVDRPCLIVVRLDRAQTDRPLPDAGRTGDVTPLRNCGAPIDVGGDVLVHGERSIAQNRGDDSVIRRRGVDSIRRIEDDPVPSL